jgi:TPR repeat protein
MLMIENSSFIRHFFSSPEMDHVLPLTPRVAFRAGVVHYFAGAHACALKCWEHAADLGCTDARFAVAVFGDGSTESNLRMLLTCYDAGHGMTKVMLGTYSYLGICGLPRDAVAAHEFWRAAANEGEIRAVYLLAVSHEERREYATSCRLLELAGRGGFVPAFSRLALYFMLGLGGLTKNADLGMSMLRQASAHGEPTSKEYLIYCYEEGIGVQSDIDAAWSECEEYWKWLTEQSPRGLCGGLDLAGWLLDRSAS